jgi:hypothetical protein
MPALARALLEALPHARGAPVRASEKLVERPVPGDWRERLIAGGGDFGVAWEGGRRMSRSEGAIAIDFPAEVPRDAAAVLAFLAPLPLELFVLSILEDYWPENDYCAPAVSADHALLGWGMVLKGAGHERSVVSRRWLEHGPVRTLRGEGDTTLVQFCELGAGGPTSLAQARPAHDWIAVGFLRPTHHYKHDIDGVYTRSDGLLRILVNARSVTDGELRDACAARRDRASDRDKPIRNIAYVFVDEQEARARLEAVWLRGLECRVADGLGERRLDDRYQVAVERPAWARRS